MEDLRDVESINLYSELCKTMSHSDAFHKILAGTRDHARTPMQWSDEKYAGFSTTQPWINTDGDCEICNAAAQSAEEDSVWNFYRTLLALRKKSPAFPYGTFQAVNKEEKNLFTYYRTHKNTTFYIECHLSKGPKQRTGDLPQGKRLLSNYPESAETEFRPYEANVWLME